MKIIKSNHLLLYACSLELIEAILKDTAHLNKLLNLEYPVNKRDIDKTVFEAFRSHILKDPDSFTWWSYLIVLKEKKALIGDCGYKGPPDETGVVEIGYKIFENYQLRGYGKETAQALIRNAKSSGQVTKIIAHTESRFNASTSILKANGFHKHPQSLMMDSLWRWELNLLEA